MGSAEGEAIAVPDAGGAGGSRAHQGGDAGCAMQSLPRVCGKGSYGAGTAGSSGIRHARRRERQLDSVCLIGQGSAALVYLVRCKETGKMSALKVQRKAEHARSVDRVHMEREVMADARHPLVTPLYQAFQDRLYLYLDMEYCPGGSLDNFVRYYVKRNLTEDEARFYAAEITLGLEFLHSKGYVYRDLKAANVLVAASGHIKLTDFGIAERGKVKVETDDKMVSPPRSLPRTKSSPVIVEESPPQAIPSQQASTHARRQTFGDKTFAPGILEPSPLAVAEARPRAQDSYLRGRTTPGSVASGEDAGAPPNAIETLGGSTLQNSTREAASGYSSFFRRRQQQQQQKHMPSATGATPPRPPGLGSRMRDRLRRGSGGSVSAGSISCPMPSVTPGSADARGGDSIAQSGGDIGMPPPSPRRFGAAVSRDAGRKQPDVRGLGLPPAGPEDGFPREKCGSPPSRSDGTQTSTRQTTVTLSEASWGVLSGSPEYMAPEVLMHDAQGSAVDWWGLGILTYELLLGRTPFAGDNGKTRLTFLNIMHKETQFPERGEREEGDVSEVCQDFIRALLTKDPRGRAGSRGAQAVKAHPFLSSVSWSGLLKDDAPLRPPRGHPPPVDNSSGWWWDVEDAIAAEAGEADLEQGRGPGQASDGLGGREDGWWPFDKFDWSNGAEEGGRFPCGSGPERQDGPRGKLLNAVYAASPGASGAFEATRKGVFC